MQKIRTGILSSYNRGINNRISQITPAINPTNMKFIISFTFLVVFTMVSSQSIPYSSLPEYPEKFTAGTVAARMIDGLGFRYYWATEGLTEADLNYRPSEGARTSDETTTHIFNLALIIVNSTRSEPTILSSIDPPENFNEKRIATLQFLQEASETLVNATDADFDKFKIIFQSQDGGGSEYPFWNQLNGPIADALWHTGQVVSFRRASGNPFNSKVSVLSGKIRN